MTAIVYDIEVFPNCFTLSACPLGEPEKMTTWEMSARRDDRAALIAYFNWLHDWQIEMIGFNNLAYDYPVIHYMFQNMAKITELLIYDKSMSIINSQDRFPQTVWQSDRFAPQIDLYKIHHFDNMAKRQSLKGLEFNMRSETVQDMPVEVNTFLTAEQIELYLIPYNRHDVKETNRFAEISADNIKFRRELIASGKVTGDVLNFNDTKIGKQMFEQRLGDDLCFDRSSGRKVPRQTPRASIPINPIVFPYIRFETPELNRVLTWLRGQTIVNTKGAFAEDQELVTATLTDTFGRQFAMHFGTGGIHGSITSRAVYSDADYSVEDIDVASLYPAIGIQNQLSPAHLGEKFVEVWVDIVAERKLYAKGTSENAGLKLAGNGSYGDSNNAYSPLFDPQFTMTITINGQLMLAMLAERLVKVPTLELIQVNTDGITYRVMRCWLPRVMEIRKEWEALTQLVLEDAHYSRMFIRDVNNYVAEKEKTGELKAKGAYWYPVKFPEDISKASPSAWHKDLSSPVIQMAAQAAMIKGVDPAVFIWSHTEPFDFMLRAKVDRASKLFIGETEVQRITRYYIAKDGGALRKISPPTGTPGMYKKGAKASDADYYTWEKERGDVYNPELHTKNQSRHELREMGLQKGWLVAECNHVANFRWENLNRDWYINEARKLIIK